MRRSCLLSRKAAAEFLGVSLRTVAYWEAGRCRVPWSVVRLLRVLRLGDLGALSGAWAGWSLHGGALHSPEGRAFTPHESSWWALLVAQARAFRDNRAQLGGVGAVAPARPQAVPPQLETWDAAPLDADAAGHGAGAFPLNALQGMRVPLFTGWAAVWWGGARPQGAPPATAGLVSLSTKGTHHADFEHFTGLRAVADGGNLGPLWPHGLTLDAHPCQAESASASRAQGPGRDGGLVSRSESQRSVRDGPALLCSLSGAQVGGSGRLSSPGPSRSFCAGSSGQAAGGARSGGGAECALPLRLRVEVQTLLRTARDGVEGAAPGELVGDPGAAGTTTTGGDAPKEFVA